MNNKRFYNFIVIIYEDDENFDKQYFNLLLEKDEIHIRHDKDIFDKDVFEEDNETIKYHAGDDKKPHFHFILKLKNACTISALAKRIEVKENMIEPIKKSLNGALKYLVHYGYDDKYQYDSSLVKSNSDKLLAKFLDLVTKDVPEVDKVVDIQNYIESFPDIIEFGILGRYVQKMNLWDAFRRNITYFSKLVDSHNSRIAASRFHTYRLVKGEDYNE